MFLAALKRGIVAEQNRDVAPTEDQLTSLPVAAAPIEWGDCESDDDYDSPSPGGGSRGAAGVSGDEHAYGDMYRMYEDDMGDESMTTSPSTSPVSIKPPKTATKPVVTTQRQRTQPKRTTTRQQQIKKLAPETRIKRPQGKQPAKSSPNPVEGPSEMDDVKSPVFINGSKKYLRRRPKNAFTKVVLPEPKPNRPKRSFHKILVKPSSTPEAPTPEAPTPTATALVPDKQIPTQAPPPPNPPQTPATAKSGQFDYVQSMPRSQRPRPVTTNEPRERKMPPSNEWNDTATGLTLTTINFGGNSIAITVQRSHIHLQQFLALHKSNVDAPYVISMIQSKSPDSLLYVPDGPYRGVFVDAQATSLWVIPYLTGLTQTGPLIAFVTIHMLSDLSMAGFPYLAAVRDSVWSSTVSFYCSSLRLAHGRLEREHVVAPLRRLWADATAITAAMPHRILPPNLEETCQIGNIEQSRHPKHYVEHVLLTVLTALVRAPFGHIPLAYLIPFSVHLQHITRDMHGASPYIETSATRHVMERLRINPSVMYL